MAPVTTAVRRARSSLQTLNSLRVAASAIQSSDVVSAQRLSSLPARVSERADASAPSSSGQSQREVFATAPALASRVQSLLARGQHVPALRLLLGKVLPLPPRLSARPPVFLAHTYDAVLQDAARRGDATAAWALTARMWSLGLPLGFVAHASALSALCRGQGVRQALRYLRSVGTRQLDTRLLNIVLDAAARQGDRATVEDALKLLTRRGLTPDAGTWIARMELAVRCPEEGTSALHAVQQLTEDALCAVPKEQHAQIRAGLVSVLASTGEFERAEEALVTLLDKHGSALPLAVELREEAASVESELTEDSDYPTTADAEVQFLRAACNSALWAADARGDVGFCDRVRQLMIQRGLTPDGSTFDALLSGALRRGAGPAVVEEAWNEMEQLGIQPTPRSWRLRLGALAQSGDGTGALNAWQEMRAAALPFDSLAQASVFTAAGASGDLALLRSFFDEQLREECMGTPESFVAAYGGIIAWGRRAADARANELACDYEDGFPLSTPNPAQHQYERGLAAALLRQMEEAQKAGGVGHTASTLRALVAALGHAGGAARVRSVLHAADLPLTAPLLSAAVAACCRSGRVADATAILERARKQGVEPDARTFTSLIAGCSFRKQSDLAWQLLGQLRERGMAPGTHAYNALLKVECFSHGPDAGLRVLNAMHAAAVPADTVTWTTLLATGQRAGRQDIVDQALEELRGETSQRENISDDDDDKTDQQHAQGNAFAEHWRGFYAQDDDDEW